MKIKVLVLFFLFFISNCAHKTEPIAANGVIERGLAAETEEIEIINEDVLNKIEPIGSEKIIKFSILKDNKGKFTKLLIQSSKYPFHHNYLTTKQEFKGLTHKEIESLTYKKSPERKAYIGILSFDYNWFADLDVPSRTGFYIMSDELPSVELLSSFRDLLNKKIDSSRGNADNFYPLPPQEVEAISKKDIFDKLNLNLSIANKQKVMTYADGWSVGRVVVLKNQGDLEQALKENKIKTDSVLLVGEALRELPPCGGVISAVPLTSSSHMALLAQMYGIPLVYQEDAIGKYSNLSDQTVFFSSSLDIKNQYQLFTKLSDDEIKRLQSAKKKKTLNFEIDDSPKQIVEVLNLKPSSVASYGGKSTKFGLLRKVIPQNTREVAAAIPIYFFKSFLKTAKVESNSLEKAIISELDQLKSDSNYNEVAKAAEKIRDLFKVAVIGDEFFSNIKTSLLSALKVQPAEGKELRLKLRSSSNVEDGAEFNGAGLYESEGVCVANCKKDDFVKGLRKVWGSLYTARGLWARRQFDVNENKVGMGVLAHQPFKNELFNGVVRFGLKRVFDGSETSILPYAEFSTQKGEESSVTNAEGEGVAELATWRNDKFEINKPFKGLPPGRALMNLEQYKTIYNLMNELAKSWSEKKENLQIEAEWKLMPEENVEKIYIKQVREIPIQSKINLADKSERLWITGDVLELKGPGTNIFDPILGLHRIREIKIEIKSFTENELRAGKLKIKKMYATVKDDVLKLKPGKIQVTLSNRVWKVVIPVNSKELKNANLTFLLPQTNEFITSPNSHSMSFSYSAQITQLSGQNQNISDRIAEESLMPANSYLENFKILSDKAQELKIISSKSCSISLKANRGLFLGAVDRERMYFNSIKIEGVLDKPIRVLKVSDSFHQHYIHDGLNVLAIDLFSDLKLSSEEKEMIDKMGRYLIVDLVHIVLKDNGIKTIFKEDEMTGSYKFITSDFKEGNAPKECTVME